MAATSNQDGNTGEMTTSRTKGTILIVEDDVEARDALSDFLSLHDYRVITAANGREGLAALKSEQRPDVIILDILMPGINGFRFRRLQKREPALASIPVIVTTAIGRAAGIAADLIMQKPLDLQVLLREVERFCAGNSAAAPRD